MTLSTQEEKLVASALTPHFLGDQQQALVALADVTVDVAVATIDAEISGVQEQLDDLKSTEGAGLVGIEDAGGHFTATDVEGALAELAVSSEAFDPSDSYEITGSWNFTQTLEAALDGTASLTALSFVDGSDTGTFQATLTDDRTWDLPDATGTFALTDDIPVQVNLIAGTNITITGSYPDLTVQATAGGGIPDAPSDGETYGRKDGAWEEIATVSGVSSVNGQTGVVVLNAADVGATANTGTVTSVNIVNASGISFTGGPVSTSGTFTPALSTNLQGWHSVAPSSKADTSSVVNTTSNQTGIAGNKVFISTVTANLIADSYGDVRRTKAQPITSSGIIHEGYLNYINEKTNTSNLTLTIPPSFGTFGDITTFSNQGSSGTITIARGSGVSLYKDGVNANIVVQPGHSVTIYRTGTSNRWAS